MGLIGPSESPTASTGMKPSTDSMGMKPPTESAPQVSPTQVPPSAGAEAGLLCSSSNVLSSFSGGVTSVDGALLAAAETHSNSHRPRRRILPETLKVSCVHVRQGEGSPYPGRAYAVHGRRERPCGTRRGAGEKRG